MVEVALLATMALTAVLLVGVVALLTKSRYRHPAFQPETAGGTIPSAVGGRLDRWSTQPGAWFVAFLLVTFGALGTTVLAVVGDDPTGNPAIFVAVAAIALGVVAGSYIASRSAGMGTAGSSFVTGTFIGVLLTVGMAVYLLLF